jgi:hypothetical protein
VIVLRNVTKSYAPGQEALSGLTLGIPRGAFGAIRPITIIDAPAIDFLRCAEFRNRFIKRFPLVH